MIILSLHCFYFNHQKHYYRGYSTSSWVYARLCGQLLICNTQHTAFPFMVLCAFVRIWPYVLPRPKVPVVPYSNQHTYSLCEIHNAEWSVLTLLVLRSECQTLRPRQNGRQFPDDKFKCIILMKIYKFRLRFQ